MNKVLSVECINFLNALHSTFENSRQSLLKYRSRCHPSLEFNTASKDMRTSDWKCDPIPEELSGQRIEITGPPDRKMIINALNSGAKVYMSDFEDSYSPTWNNILQGHKNLMDACDRSISVLSGGKTYTLNDDTALLMVRPRGLHLTEKHFFDMSASLFDFGVYLFHNTYSLLAHNTRPYFYLPKLENHTEAEWWANVFRFSENYLEVPRGSIRCTVLIETLPAAFQMHEIAHCLQQYITGFNFGRWDYVFSYIKCLPQNIIPERSKLSMDLEFLDTVAKLIVQTCNRRGITPIGGMSAYVPVKDTEANVEVLEKVYQDKLREHQQGFNGAWIAHPALLDTVKKAFATERSPCRVPQYTENELQAKLLSHPTMMVYFDDNSVRLNVSESLEYMANWLQGKGCVAINNQMQDLATFELARRQIWQWSSMMSYENLHKIFREEYGKLIMLYAEQKDYYDSAMDILKLFSTDFSTHTAYEVLLKNEKL